MEYEHVFRHIEGAIALYFNQSKEKFKTSVETSLGIKTIFDLRVLGPTGRSDHLYLGIPRIRVELDHRHHGIFRHVLCQFADRPENFEIVLLRVNSLTLQEIAMAIGFRPMLGEESGYAISKKTIRARWPRKDWPNVSI